MKKSSNLKAAKKTKNDEFYTQYKDIEKEINAYLDYNPNVFRDKVVLCPCDDPGDSNFTKYFAQNFERFGLKKLISTSYSNDPNVPGKIFEVSSDITGDGKINIEDLTVRDLKGNGDFRSKEVTLLRDQVDFIITNPPFSLFREFLSWVIESRKQFVIIGNMNAISYKEVFPLIKDNRVWLGATGFVTDMVFKVPEGTIVKESDKLKAERLGYKGNYTRLGNSCWFTNIEHGRRRQPLQLMSATENLKYSRHKSIKGKTFEEAYPKYDNYDAINVNFTDAIPSDYEGEIGVPISFLDKYCPDQFEIIGGFNGSNISSKSKDGYVLSKDTSIIVNGEEKQWNGPVVNKQPLYYRIVIRKKQ